MVSELEEAEKEYMKLAEIPEVKRYLKEVEALEEKVQQKWDKWVTFLVEMFDDVGYFMSKVKMLYLCISTTKKWMKRLM